ncbi:MAG: FAD-dependent monooxygenase [Pseudonocardia sp.]|nr:FAD-dependent monooxygenase [Pseudonocardia sp.]
MTSGDSYDLVVVGGGIAGSALATVLARDGFDVLVLERQTSFRDKVRGEVLVCWGVAELLRLELEKPLLEAGGAYVTRYVSYDENVDPLEAEAAARPLDQLLPGVPGALDVGHPQACEALIGSAAAAGATVVRGVGDVEVTAGRAPAAVRYEHDDVGHDVTCRLVVGADGRMSTVRRQLGIGLEQSAPRTMGGGMLVDELHSWPAHQASVGTEGDLHYLIFPRPDGRVRLYLLHDIAQKGRFSGPERGQDFLAAYRFRCIPNSDMFLSARPSGPCAFYPMNDSWTARTYAPGAVLIGDAAGWNDPIIGQGLSIAMRDARMVADILRSTKDWTPGSFAEYGDERRERMRRLRIAARLATDLRATFTPRGAGRRRSHTALMATDLVVAGPVLATQIGPEQAPVESFDHPNIERILALA